MRREQYSALANILTKKFNEHLTARILNRRNLATSVIPSGKILTAFLMLILPLVVFSQTASTKYPTNSYTPSSLATGSPLGSYSISDIENVNLFNGNLNITLPIINIGGRGSAGYTMSLPFNPKWRIQDAYYPSGTWGGTPPPLEAWAHHYYPVTSWWTEGAGYGPGIMRSRRSSTFTGPCPYSPDSRYDGGEILTQITFSGPGGTEMSFFDRRTGGTPAVYTGSSGCLENPAGAFRGNIWVTGDGSNVTFVGDVNFTEYPGSNLPDIGRPSGDMYFPDGTHYRIDSGSVTYINDRNGNKTSFTYSSNGDVATITDSLNRTITISSSGGSFTFPGVGGTPRTIEVGSDSIGNVLQTGYALKGNNELFSQLGADVQSQITPQTYNVTSYVKLPNNKQYNFKYNSYGDVARIELPTGGAIEYDWGGTATTGCGARIRRWVTERRVYPNGGTGTSYESKTKYEYGGDTIDGQPVKKTTVTSYNGDTPLSVSKHYFTLEEPPCDYYSPHVYYYLPTGQIGREIQTESYLADGTTLLRREKTDFEFRTMATVSGNKQVDYRPIRETSTLADVSPNLVSKQEFGYAPNVDLTRKTDVWDYDYGSGQAGSFKRRQHTDYLTTNLNQSNANYLDNSIYLRNLPSQTWVSSDINGANKVSLTQFEYDNYAVNPLVPRTNIIGHDTTNYGMSKTIRGNLTKTTSYSDVNNSSTAISTKAQYDILGNVVKTWDANGNATTIDYTDRFGSPDNEARSNTAPTQLGGQSTFAFPTSSTNTLNWVIGYTQFDYFTGAAVNTEDINGVISKTIYNDLLDRPTQSVTAIGTAFEKQSNVIYDDANHRIEAKSDLNALNDNLLKSESFYDGLGRTIENRRYEADGNFIASKSIPFVMVTDPETGILRVGTKSSNPYRPNAGEQPVWTTSLSDALGRSIKTITPDGAIAKTDYSGNATILTDERGKKRRTVEDALDNLIRVDEPNESNDLGAISSPTLPTYYSYDTLGNLTQIGQGEQTRTFTYNSLSRLLSATNPESGTFQYSYDANGNLLTKTDARNISTTYTYDALNRATFRNYSDDTPDISYVYDDTNVPFSKGKLTKISSSVSETRYTAFDIQDRTLSTQQIIDGQTYAFSYTYNLSGDLLTQTYPSGKIVKFDYNNDGDLAQVSNQQTQKVYANSFSYSPHGKIERMRFGNGKFETTKFNSALQITQIGLGHSATDTSLWKTNYEYGDWENGAINSQKNNGNLARQTFVVPTIGQTTGFTAVQNYTYDSLDRLKSANETVAGVEKWKQAFLYDRYTNRNFDTANTTLQSLESNVPKVANPEVLPTNNRYKQDQDNDGQADYLYDASGNLTKDAQNRTFTYDDENRQLTAVGSNLSMSYAYDGNGKRVKTFNAVTNQTTIFVYDTDGDLAAEYTINTPPPTNPTISYLTEDALGSVRVTTNSFGEVKARRDFLPFGEELYAGIGNRNVNQKYSSNADDTRKKFATYQRDVETNLDFAQSRYYSPMQGRFTSPDEFKGGPDELFDFNEDASDNPTFYADLANPQSLNKYQYTYNNPYKYNDPNGHCPFCPAQVFWGPTITETIPWFVPKPLIETIPIVVPKPWIGPGPTIIPPMVPVFPLPNTGTITVGGVRGSAQVRPRPQALKIATHTKLKGSKTKTNDKHTNAEARRQREQNRPANPNAKKPKPKTPEQEPNKTNRNKYPKQTPEVKTRVPRNPTEYNTPEIKPVIDPSKIQRLTHNR
jgi:RHS repeat-associated protein